MGDNKDSVLAGVFVLWHWLEWRVDYRYYRVLRASAGRGPGLEQGLSAVVCPRSGSRWIVLLFRGQW